MPYHVKQSLMLRLIFASFVKSKIVSVTVSEYKFYTCQMSNVNIAVPIMSNLTNYQCAVSSFALLVIWQWDGLNSRHI